MKILVTAGGTEEPVDGVRRLTNTSTGATGGVLARTFAEHGAEVLLLHAARAPLDSVAVERDTFVTFADLENALRRHLGAGDWDAVIHLAAVSDYSVASIEVDGRSVPHGDQGKIGSGHEVVIRLSTQSQAHRQPQDPGRATGRSGSSGSSSPMIRIRQTAPLESGRCWIAAPSISRSSTISESITADHHPAEIWGRQGPLVQTATKEELAEALWALLTTPHEPGPFADLLAGKFPEVNP